VVDLSVRFKYLGSFALYTKVVLHTTKNLDEDVEQPVANYVEVRIVVVQRVDKQFNSLWTQMNLFTLLAILMYV